MNIQRIKKLRDFIAKLPPKACNMDVWIQKSWVDEEGQPVDAYTGVRPITPIEMQQHGFKCGTTACIGGWTEVMSKLEDPKSRKRAAGSYLQLTRIERKRLFYQYRYPKRPTRGSWKAWMLRRLDGIIKTKKILPIDSDG